jgi:uncharacterized membrane protein HdeD (DUF308 family)
MDIAKTQQLRLVGIVFLGCGVAFLGAGLATRIIAFYTLGPALAVMGVAFLASSKLRRG